MPGRKYRISNSDFHIISFSVRLLQTNSLLLLDIFVIMLIGQSVLHEIIQYERDSSAVYDI